MRKIAEDRLSCPARNGFMRAAESKRAVSMLAAGGCCISSAGMNEIGGGSAEAALKLSVR